jgi:outer membrane receptor protein involved in Fe transport
MLTSLYEDINPLDTACSPAGCPPNNLDFSDHPKYPAITYSDIRLQWDTGRVYSLKNIAIYAGVDNIFDKHPPLGLSGTGILGNDRVTNGAAAIYDIRGRNYYAGLKVLY